LSPENASTGAGTRLAWLEGATPISLVVLARSEQLSLKRNEFMDKTNAFMLDAFTWN
jgi:hypothetical protein